MKTTKKQFTVYIAAAFALAWILQITASVFAASGRVELFRPLLVVTMCMPLLAALIARVPLRGMGFVPHLKGKLRYLFFALWSPALLSVLGAFLFFAVFPHTFDSGLTALSAQLEAVGALAQLEAQGLTVPMYVAIGVVSTLTYAPFINMIPALGEEIGWRGAMYPYLKEHFGVLKGRIFGGIIWGVWHWPLIILAGYEYGTAYLGAPVLGPIVFCLSTVFMGILLDYVYEKTESIWLPSLMHGAINAFTIPLYLIKPEFSNLVILGPIFIGLIGMLPMAALAIFLSKKQ